MLSAGPIFLHFFAIFISFHFLHSLLFPFYFFIFLFVLYVYDGKDDELWGMQGLAICHFGNLTKGGKHRYPGLLL